MLYRTLFIFNEVIVTSALHNLMISFSQMCYQDGSC